MRSSNVRLGRLPAVHDARVPRFAMLAGGLPEPPETSNWMAGVPYWTVPKANTIAGCCVQNAVMNFVRQQSCYMTPGFGLAPTDAETLDFYSQSTGWNPDDPTTDRGSVVMGPGGVMQYWLQHGITAGGKLNKVSAFVALDSQNPRHFRQCLDVLGGSLVGVGFPTNLLSGPEVPFVWRDISGPRAGHEIYFPGTYETVGTETLYDLVSWNEHFRIPEGALLQIIDEIVGVFDDAFIDARGLNAAGIPKTALLAAMAALRTSAA